MQKAPSFFEQLIDLFAAASLDVVPGQLDDVQLPQRQSDDACGEIDGLAFLSSKLLFGHEF